MISVERDAAITALVRNVPDAQERPDFSNPVETARAILRLYYSGTGHCLLHYWQGEFHHWDAGCYGVLPQVDVRAQLYRVGAEWSKVPVNKRMVDNVLDALRAEANLSHRIVPSAPAFYPRDSADPNPRSVIPLRNGILDLDTGTLLPLSPRLFVPYCLPFDYNAQPEPPRVWLAFLASVWPDDSESIECLQEFVGYLQTPDTSQQKALLIVGPKRSGKGTIARVIERLLGVGNVASPTLASLGSQFGLQPLIGKTCALVSDARLSGRADIASIAENLLRLTGEDAVNIDRKFQTAYTARLIARLVVLGNEVPAFRDAASALPSRFIVLRTTRSFYGEEDLGLEARLVPELPSIFGWGLTGLHRLRARGRFLQPRSAMDSIRLMQDLASPIGAYLRDRCIVEPGAMVPIQRLYADWRAWCDEHGREHTGTEQTFGRDLSAAAPAVRITQPRVNGQRVRYYNGVRLRTPDDPIEDGETDELF